MKKFEEAPSEWRLIQTPSVDRIALQRDNWYSKHDLRLFSNSYQSYFSSESS